MFTLTPRPEALKRVSNDARASNSARPRILRSSFEKPLCVRPTHILPETMQLHARPSASEHQEPRRVAHNRNVPFARRDVFQMDDVAGVQLSRLAV